MRIYETTVYECEYCRKKYFRKHHAEYHETWCTSNPKNFKACYGCKFCEKEEFELDGGNPFMTPIKSFCLRCTKLDKYMYTFSMEKKIANNWIIGDLIMQNIDQEPMPKECEFRIASFLEKDDHD